jgi:hypothetical protein
MNERGVRVNKLFIISINLLHCMVADPRKFMVYLHDIMNIMY